MASAKNTSKFKASTEVAKVNANTKLAAITDELPDYLKGNEKLGTEALGKEDVKIPRIKILQPLTPEVNSYRGKAIPGEFWHTGANLPLGSEFKFIPVIVGKRVVLWRPRDDGNGGILAFSRDAVKWISGANQKFEVKLKGVKGTVTWETGKDVASSGLLEFGSSNPDEPNSAPAATLAYEYLAYLPDHPELSPVVLGVMKTGIPNAKALNSYLLQMRRPTTCLAIRCFSDEVTKGRDSWHVPKFEPAGYATKEVFDMLEKMKENYADYQTDMTQEDEDAAPIDNVAY